MDDRLIATYMPVAGNILDIEGGIKSMFPMSKINEVGRPNGKGLPFPEYSFVAVFDIDLRGNIEQIITEYRRVLKLGGKLVIAMWCHGGDEPRLIAALSGFQINSRKIEERKGDSYQVVVVARKN